MIHPWTSGPISQAPWWDLGAVLYTHAHSVHHKSTNPGPWSGMSMHPVEHFFYFQCAWLPLLAAAVPALAMHPMHFLYAIFHACVAPIAGHDGYAAPGGNSDYHYLHHAHLEVNYGVPCVTAERRAAGRARTRYPPRPPPDSLRTPLDVPLCLPLIKKVAL